MISNEIGALQWSRAVRRAARPPALAWPAAEVLFLLLPGLIAALEQQNCPCWAVPAGPWHQRSRCCESRTLVGTSEAPGLWFPKTKRTCAGCTC